MPATYSGALTIVRTLRAFRHEALLAGGCVRDRLRSVEPHDYDIATSAFPDQVQEIFPDSQAVGAAFGVMLVILDGHPYEVATFRTDGPYVDGRHPESVEFGSVEEDARRRDFTVNGLFFNPDKNEVLDFVGGRADLAAKVLRAIGGPSARFNEDKLRVLRCVRFACQLGFSIEADTWAAAKTAARDMGGVAMERVAAELTKILQTPQPRRGMELLDEAGLLAVYLPELDALKGCPQPPEFHPEGDVWEHTLRVLDAMTERGVPSRALAWAALLHDIAKPATLTNTDRLRFHGHDTLGAVMALKILDRLKMGGEVRDAAGLLVADHLRLDPLRLMKVSTLKRLMRREDIEDLLTLHMADCLGSHGDLELYYLARVKQRQLRAAKAADGLRPEPLVDGSDLIAWGYSPGPAFKDILTAVEDEQLEGRLKDKVAARAFVEDTFQKF
jgi:poly(A) polymerase